MGEEQVDLVIAGGGPAGMMAGLLFARAGVRTVVIEKHSDFLRDFRGDTVHPSTLRIFDELGLLDRFLERPHDKVRSVGAYVGDRHFKVADFSRLSRRWGFIAMVPQWDFLDFVADDARTYPNFSLLMEAEALRLIEAEGRVEGVVARVGGEERQLRARLTIAADGRGSVLRAQSGLPRRSLGAPIDVFWFRMPKRPTPENDTTGIFAAGRIIALIDRGDYWQCAYVFAKGEAERVKARGLEAFRDEVARLTHRFEPDLSEVRSWDDVRLLTVALDRLDKWHRPGLLVIGDAAHAMSPVGGVGINVAIQDAVAAANLLAAPLDEGRDVDALLERVERRRKLPVRLVQAFQAAAQKRIIAPLLSGAATQVRPPLALRLMDRFALLR
ncbi:MAG: FAD-dependent oxidoreductase, partial [Pseudomonadota bacterium]|nr:FAD-dependent oxidoreductase [Pseudomonadota bacterium]